MSDAAHWHLAFDAAVAGEPVLWELGDRFGLHTNIRRANVDEHVAWVIVEVRGERLPEARAWLLSRGIRVSDLDSPAPA